MHAILDQINNFFGYLVPITDFLWDFPTNLGWYASIPILGRFSFAILLLVGSGIYLTFKYKFVQFRYFSKGLRILIDKKAEETGVTPWASFMLSCAMRMGPGNMLGVTGAISVGGPGSIFWMWVAALFGMATGFAEATLAQIFKSKKGDEYIGGLPFYGKMICGNKHWVGIALAWLYIIYALLCVPGQTFHLFTSLGALADTVTGTHFDRTSSVYIVIGLIVTIGVALSVMFGIKRVTKITDVVVPIKALIYTGLVFILILCNLSELPYFFKAVFSGAFTPDAIFGGIFGVTLSQGIKRGLMSNEAGQGTTTMAAAVADQNHPIEQGFIQSCAVFIDTFVICTASAFLVIMGHIWQDPSVDWAAIHSSKLTVFLGSIQHLVPWQSLAPFVLIIILICYALFAFTCLIGLILFAEISANYISRSAKFIWGIRAAGALFFVPFGALTVFAGLELGNIWQISDFVNIIMVYVNVPILLIASSKIIMKSLKHYISTDGGEYNSEEVIGIATECWTGKQVGVVGGATNKNTVQSSVISS